MKINAAIPRRIGGLTVLFLLFTAILVFLGYAYTHYYSVPVFYLDREKFTLDHTENGKSLYTSSSGTKVLVQNAGDNRELSINGKTFSIIHEKALSGFPYEVRYPEGTTYRVTRHGDMFLALDEQGEFIPELTVEMNGNRILSPGEERYFPSALVTAAYPEFHNSQGSFGILVLSVALFLFGWCTFRFEKFQRILFWASLRWIWFEQPEPSDFYFFTSKIGGIVIMLGSIVVAFQSL
ncbi:hypothetical protein J41TS12_15670 [Paenibacillus antibioticophila]|uniref:DUF6199 domain-containing protein n=1 Tax=Paenibacillus antibioticophila TaxID=1274374 RepID=A0A919XQS7_9BACL|nr:hypothetical protein [Paenibacillus antibioticophila]GIO36706.1 hypothetical protein J41TS12_15670 [Paenibacillus antibioticophila]